MDLNSVIYDISGWFTGNDAGICAMLDDIQETRLPSLEL